MAKFFLTVFSLLLIFSIGVFAFDHFAPQIEVSQKLQALIQKLTAGEEVDVKTQKDLTQGTTAQDETPDSENEDESDENLTFAEMLAKETKNKNSKTTKNLETEKTKTQTSTPKKTTNTAKSPPASTTKPASAGSTKSSTKSTAKSSAASSTISPSTTSPKGWSIQVGAFRTDAEAQRLAEDLEKNRYPHFVYQTTINGNIWYRVNIGPFDSPGAAATFKQSRGIGQKFKGAFVKKL